VELTGTNGAATNCALYGDGWTNSRYAFVFGNCKFGDAHYCHSFVANGSYYGRTVTFLFCDFDIGPGNATYGNYTAALFGIYHYACKFISRSGTCSYQYFAINCASVYDGCIFDGSGGTVQYAIYGGSYPSYIRNCLFTGFTRAPMYVNSISCQVIEFNNVFDTIVTNDWALRALSGTHFSNFSVSDEAGTQTPDLYEMETPVGNLHGAEESASINLTWNSLYELSSPKGILENGMPDIYGRPTMRGPAQVDPRQLQGMV